MINPVHRPVLVDETLEALAAPAGGRVIDATIDGGGHTRALLQGLGAGGAVLGLDRDPDIIEALRTSLAAVVSEGRLRLVGTSFVHLEAVATAEGFLDADAVLFDLGISSYHLDASGRGFSFERDEPLDLRFDASDPDSRPAAELLRRLGAAALADVIHSYGEERYARRIARHIHRVRSDRRIETATALRDTVLEALPGPARRHGRRSVARVFQALRIATNRELDAVEAALPQAIRVLRPGGRVAVIAFHSLEDRLVKHFFRAAAARGELTIVTKKPVWPTVSEIERNPRAASARLRVAERN
jgi:16S rRNA (cytosine1402-N4)-methyltransferase